MFERFTDRARKSVVWAQEEARALNHKHIGTEHLLLGLLREGEGVAARALDAEGLTLESVREAVRERVGTGTDSPGAHMPFTPRAKKVLELALRESIALEHGYLGTEHILLGLVEEGEGVAAQILLSSVEGGIERVRLNVVEILSGALPSRLARGIEERLGRIRPVRPRVGFTMQGPPDEVIKRLEAIEARLSSIERLLRGERGEEDVS